MIGWFKPIAGSYWLENTTKPVFNQSEALQNLIWLFNGQQCTGPDLFFAGHCFFCRLNLVRLSHYFHFMLCKENFLFSLPFPWPEYEDLLNISTEGKMIPREYIPPPPPPIKGRKQERTFSFLNPEIKRDNSLSQGVESRGILFAPVARAILFV